MNDPGRCYLSPRASAAESRGPVAVGTEGTVLIVEDEAELAEVLEYNLRKNGYSVHSAPDGLTACRLIAAVRPDLILLDILLPDLDGWEICRQVRRHPDPAVAATPIVMLTALGTPDHRLKGLELGADAYIGKPYSLQEVLLTARTLINRARRASALAGELEALRAGTRLQADIQGMLFHELRNQMVVVGGYTRLLLKEEGIPAAEKSKAYIDTVNRSSEHLARLAEELLRAGQLSPGALALSFTPLHPTRAIEEVAALLAPLARQKGARIEVEAQDGLALANEPALRLVLSILLENALKYGGEGNVVHLRSARRNGRHRLEVEDRGPGIAEEEVPLIFEKSYRGKGGAGRIPGTGMGLHIARTLATVMGGELEVRSRPGEGSCFRLWLRAVDPEAAPPPLN